MLLVTFSGIDGAGKSTLIRRLQQRLQNAGVEVLLLAFWQDAAVLRGLREFASHRVLGGESGIGEPTAPIARRDKNVRALPLTVFRLLFYLLDAARLRVVIARARSRPEQVVLFDRYLYDEIANLPLTARFARTYARLLVRLAPRPDLACLVDADPAVARRRKPEYPLEFLHSNRQSFFALGELTGGMLVLPPLAADEAEKRVLQDLLGRLRPAMQEQPIRQPTL